VSLERYLHVGLVIILIEARKIISNHLHIVSIMIVNSYPYVKRHDEPFGSCVIRIV